MNRTSPAQILPLRPPQEPRLPPRSPEAEEIAALDWIEAFATLARNAIEEEDDEPLRRRYEDELLRRAGWLRATGLFEIMAIRHPALRAMVDHETG